MEASLYICLSSGRRYAAISAALVAVVRNAPVMIYMSLAAMCCVVQY
jgi:hypothetical protein